MRRRIEHAVREEQRHRAEKELDSRVDDLLQALARHILACALPWSERVNASSQKEYIDHSHDAAALSWEGWQDPELADVRCTMTEIQELVDLRVRRPDDAAAATPEGEADGIKMFPPTTTVLVSGGSALPASPVPFYTAFVRQLIERIFVYVTKAALSRVISGDHAHGVFRGAGAAEDDTVLVQCSASNEASSVFPANSVLCLPVIIYIGWRCGYSLLTSIGRMLCMADDDRAAAWLDVTSAALRSLLDGALAHGGGPSTASAGAAADALYHFVVRAKIQTGALQSLWWWLSRVFEHGCTHGLLTTPSSVPSCESSRSTPASMRVFPNSIAATAATADGRCGSKGGATMHTSLAHRDDYRTLWYVGRTESAAYLSSTVLPTVAHFLHTALARFVFSAAESSPDYWSSHAAQLTEALQAVRDVAVHLFPTPAPSISVSPSAVSPSSPIHFDAATASFLRHAVHDALLPLAECVLDDPSLLQGRILPAEKAGFMIPAAAPTTPRIAHDGWSSSCEDEWEGAQVGDDARCSSTTEITVTAAPPAEASQSTLAYALDTLEREFGDLVRADSVVMTLRRL
ncbi:hypothetical protein, unknown function [Leishmania tarentolae]|uniref:Uncharacterized protein n=1 Tax=Leishmania tarentolae TaxID=5689 RepID=A0A640KC50_LEITA|nr:hypothetical protein, unknown function [Leishmania tarentolae]